MWHSRPRLWPGQRSRRRRNHRTRKRDVQERVEELASTNAPGGGADELTLIHCTVAQARLDLARSRHEDAADAAREFSPEAERLAASFDTAIEDGSVDLYAMTLGWPIAADLLMKAEALGSETARWRSATASGSVSALGQVAETVVRGGRLSRDGPSDAPGARSPIKRRGAVIRGGGRCEARWARTRESGHFSAEHLSNFGTAGSKEFWSYPDACGDHREFCESEYNILGLGFLLRYNVVLDLRNCAAYFSVPVQDAHVAKTRGRAREGMERVGRAKPH